MQNMSRGLDKKAALRKFNKQRGDVITNFAFIEHCISMFIAGSYFKEDEFEQMNTFRSEILDDKFFSFEFKRQIFIKILKNRFPEVYKNMPLKKIEKMQSLRNIVAHGPLSATGRKDRPNKVYDICFRHGGTNHPADKLLEEYEKLRMDVEPAVRNLPGMTTADY
jgi:hypothetical protein